MKATTVYIASPITSRLCSNAGLMLLADTADTADVVGVADAIDQELADWQNPNLVHTTGHTMASLALAQAIGGDDADDIDLLNPLVATGLINQVPSGSAVHRWHKELADYNNPDQDCDTDDAGDDIVGAGTLAVLAG